MKQLPPKDRRIREVNMSDLTPVMEEVLDSGGTVEMTVTGNSMYPTLKHRVSQVRLDAVEPQIGDIVLYRRRNGMWVLHRIVGTEDDTFTLCGDNQWTLERGIRREQILAVVTDFRRTSRWRSRHSRPYRVYTYFHMASRPLRHLFFGGIRRIKRIVKGWVGRFSAFL